MRNAKLFEGVTVSSQSMGASLSPALAYSAASMIPPPNNTANSKLTSFILAYVASRVLFWRHFMASPLVRLWWILPPLSPYLVIPLARHILFTFFASFKTHQYTYNKAWHTQSKAHQSSLALMFGTEPSQYNVCPALWRV